MRFEDGDDDDGDASNDLERPRKIQRPTPLAEEVEAYALLLSSRSPSATTLLEAYAPSCTGVRN